MITVSAVVLAVLLSTYAGSMQEGTYARMIDNMVKFSTGYIQIHHPLYWESKSINDSYIPDSILVKTIESTEEVILAVPRLESYTLISSGENTKGCALTGIDPVLEDSLTGLSKWITEGSYLKSGEGGLLLAVNVARNLGAGPGDTLILLSQGFQGATASTLITLKGILKFPSLQLNNLAAYITLPDAQDFFGAPERITSTSLMVSEYKLAGVTADKLTGLLAPEYSVMTWDVMQPEIIQMVEGDRAGAIIMKGIIYLVAGFGILGTLIMMMAERRKEMGIMVAIGMKKYRLQRILFMESLFMGMLGVVAGVVISFPVILWFTGHPVPLTGETAGIYETFGIEPLMFFSMSPGLFLYQALTIFAITVVISLYSTLSVIRLQPVNAMRT